MELVFIVIRLTMPKGKTVFAQIMDVIPDYELKRYIDKYKDDKGTKKGSSDISSDTAVMQCIKS